MSMTMSQIYDQELDEDGFLYMVYASHEFFGWHTDITYTMSIYLSILERLSVNFYLIFVFTPKMHVVAHTFYFNEEGELRMRVR